MQTHTHQRIRSWVLAPLLLVATASAWALAFTPIEMDFTPSGRGTTQIYRIENTNAETAAVEISIKNRKMQINGEDQLSDADDDFSIFPAQVVLQPGQTQTVRVQYTGPASLTSEKAYRLIAEQLPIDIGQGPQNGGRMRLLVKYVASVYIVPAGARPKLKLAETKLTTEEGKAWLELLIHNEGSSRKILKDAQIQIAGQKIQGEELKGLEGENLLAQTQRWFRIPAPKGVTSAQNVQFTVP
jgi:fimbrial chaperone protein